MNSKKTDIAAWVGAVTGCLALLFQWYIHITSGPELKVDLLRKESIVLPDHEIPGPFIIIEVTNIGNEDSSIKRVGFDVISGGGQEMESKVMYQPNIDTTKKLPFHLKEGLVWQGAIPINSLLSESIENGTAFFTLYSSHKNDPIRVNIKEHL